MTILCAAMLFCALVVPGEGASVTTEGGEVTAYPLAAGNVFLAHDYLTGRYFDEIQTGDAVYYIQGFDIRKYEVSEIIQAQAADPTSEQTSLQIDGRWLDVAAAYERLGFDDPARVVLMTCAKNGRLFVVAE